MEGVNASFKKGPGLYEFLIEAELQQYFNSFKNTLKITHPSQLKFTTDGDLIEIGMSKPEMRRLRKYYEKHFPHNYISKFKKLLTHRKHEHSVNDAYLLGSTDSLTLSKAPRVSSKHIIPSSSITINKELGMGEFGVVQQGVWCNEGERIQSNMVEFLKEASIMHNIDHGNIVRFFGVVLPNVDGSLMLVTELAPLRSLLECLKEPSLRASFPVLTLCDFAYQICDGMQYLEANRNILVFSKNKVKISDFGLSRALGQGKDYYQTNFNVNLKLPIAWCAPECISYLRFTTASDVWAFGVCLWEMFSYGFQPWAALTGQQILEAIDEPNFQRLEQPDCCPLDHYALMAECWRHEAASRPHFADIGPLLAECRPEQVQAKASSNEGPHMLSYRVGDVITVLDKKTHQPLWKGATAGGKTGPFDPANVVAYLGSDLPGSSFLRADSARSSTRRKLRSEMISAPQGDVKHTGHVGLDGAYFGDLSFLDGSKGNYGAVPTQVVAPYRPHKDLEAAPLLLDPPAPLQDHEYHEISDEERGEELGDGESHSPGLDLGPSLMAEMEMMFSSLGSGGHRRGSREEHGHGVVDHHEGSNRSMSAPAPTTPASPNKKKFSFKFPSVHDHDKHNERRNFSEEALSTSDLQKFVSSPSSIDEPSHRSHLRLPLWDQASAEFCFAKSRELLTRPFPSNPFAPTSCRNLDSFPFEENYYHHHQFRPGYRDRTLTKSESMTRKNYSGGHRFYPQFCETSYVYYKADAEAFDRPRTLSFNEAREPFKRSSRRSIRDRNRRRQSYNPIAYESSSSDSDCVSACSVDLDWSRRRRLSKLAGSTISVRSEMVRKVTNPFLKPGFNVKVTGKSPPPSNSVLSGLSPTSLMLTNPLKILRSGQPVIASRTRSSSVASTLPPKFGTAGRGSVPENLNVRQGIIICI
ncbi:unnamed protein product [Phaedon cochleariae]|uniref:non-specific protein-tyrosine kinase n=1 Tax=Phaedon cochleariae TaxID=80249 RepID=A0A9N9SDK5_PHACE|nr:unnamed protein product [Phaedon cochleariae]